MENISDNVMKSIPFYMHFTPLCFSTLGNKIHSASVRLISLTFAVNTVFDLVCIQGFSRGLQRSLKGD